MGSISLRLDEELELRLANEAHVEGKPRSEVIRSALAEYLERRERERFMAEMVGEMRQAYSSRARRLEAIELGEELLALDAETADTGSDMNGADAQTPSDRWWK